MSAINSNELSQVWKVQQGFDVSLPGSDGFLMAAVVLCEKVHRKICEHCSVKFGDSLNFLLV